MTRSTILSLGETLWDVFPDGPRLGGAPLNYACGVAELAKSAAKAYLVSAVGDDALGQRAVESLRQHGVDASHVQIDQRETGQVWIDLDSVGAASYRFAENAAWDYLKWGADLQKLAANCDAVCFGTLGQRGECSRSTIQRLVGETPEHALRILDVNLRAPYFDDDVIRESLALANILKLNDDELPILARLCGVEGSPLEIMQQLSKQLKLRYLARTRSARGAILIAGEAISDLPGNPVNLVDTVGAGDAFTAAMTLGILAGRTLDEVNRCAIDTATYVCSQAGATMSFPENLREGTRGEAG